MRGVNKAALPGILPHHDGKDRAALYVRIFPKVSIDAETGCWLWKGSKQSNGYGRCWDGKKSTYAHRVVYELFFGRIEDGKDIDHLCRNRGCVNPLHLEQVTRSENLSRGESANVIASIQREKTHCPKGHEYSTDNTRVTKEGKRVCRKCARERFHIVKSR